MSISYSLAEVSNAKDYKEAFDVNGQFYTELERLSPDKYVHNFSRETFKFSNVCGKLTQRIFKLLASGMKLKVVEIKLGRLLFNRPKYQRHYGVANTIKYYIIYFIVFV